MCAVCAVLMKKCPNLSCRSTIDKMSSIFLSCTNTNTSSVGSLPNVSGGGASAAPQKAASNLVVISPPPSILGAASVKGSNNNHNNNNNSNVTCGNNNNNNNNNINNNNNGNVSSNLSVANAASNLSPISVETNLLNTLTGNNNNNCNNVPQISSPPLIPAESNIALANNNAAAAGIPKAVPATKQIGGTGQILNNGTKDYSDVQKLEQQLQDIKDQVRDVYYLLCLIHET